MKSFSRLTVIDEIVVHALVSSQTLGGLGFLRRISVVCLWFVSFGLFIAVTQLLLLLLLR